jgi:hypothetical protein
MIGCLILGTFGALVVAKIARHHWRWAACHGGGFCHDGAGPGGWGGAGGGWRRWHHFHRAHHGHGHHADLPRGWSDDFFGGDSGGDAPGWGDRREPRGFGRGFVLGAILDRVRATPVQERAVRAAFEEFRTELKRAADGEGKRTRQELAEALRKPAFDEVLLGELYARHDRSIENARKALVGFMAKVHDALDEEQRGRLAELVEKGPRFWRGY